MVYRAVQEDVSEGHGRRDPQHRRHPRPEGQDRPRGRARPRLHRDPGSSTAIPYAEAGYLTDLGPLAEKEGWKERILPWAYDMGVIDGKFLAVPLYYETLVVFYNKTLFTQNGWTPPTDRASLEKLAGEMQAKGIVPFVNANATYQGATDWLVSSFMNGVAGPAKINQALTGKLPLTDQSFVDSIQLLADYFGKGYFAGGAKQYFSLQDPQKYAMFAEGKAGMYISGSWEFAALDKYFKEAGSEWAEAPLPRSRPACPPRSTRCRSAAPCRSTRPPRTSRPPPPT